MSCKVVSIFKIIMNIVRLNFTDVCARVIAVENE